MALAANRRASLPPRRPPAPALRSACLLHADADAKFSCPFLQPFDDLGIEENENWRTNQNESDEQEQTNLKEYIEEDQLWDGFLRNQS
jgi:hypothetical protein